MRKAPTLLAFFLEAGIGLLIALAFMEGRGYRAGLYGALAVLVGIALWLARLDRLEAEREHVRYVDRHVATGTFKGAQKVHAGLYVAHRSNSVFQQGKGKA